MKKKVGFIYLDELQHVPHFLPPAIALAARGVRVDILTYEGGHRYLKTMLNKLGGEKLNIVQLSTFFYRKILEKLRDRQQPSAFYIYRKHLHKLLTYDALVFTDHTAGIIYQARGKAAKPKLVFIDHGAGDGAYGYKESHNLFDLVLVAGMKKATRLVRDIPDHHFKLKVAGYAKFDLLNNEKEDIRLFEEGNPVVLYCPHFSRQLSSWYSMGRDILNFFRNHPEYNLIFAPHFNLFNKKGFEKRAAVDRKYYDAPNIHVDLGSIRSVNMTYARYADIYLGDVSSQVYEFMYLTRPLIFINHQNIFWQKDDNYLMWQAGKVVTNVAGLEEALAGLDVWPIDYTARQKELFTQTFYKPDRPAGPRVAKLIADEIYG